MPSKEEIYRKQRLGIRRIGFGKKPAVIVIDMQYDFVDPKSPSTCYPMSKEIIPNIEKLLKKARAKKVPIFYTQGLVHPSLVDVGLWKSLAHMEGKVQVEGTRGAGIVKELQPKRQDFLIKKRRPSAFFQTDLDVFLKGAGVDTVILTGTSMSGCVRATATDSFMRDYRTMIVRECVADRVQDVLENNLFDLNAKYCDIVTLKETLKYLETL
ncbi:MAG: N-carbamoylsarcosine amidase [Deltaproteobacteria bacterium]|nr:N-carbamoylsarcosine amidase [Deltaproteobacteria bacterium]